MSNPLGSADFFALEAGECLDRLEQLVTRPDGPPAEELLRYARALRGSALMANHPAIARAATGIEQLARALRQGSRHWDAATRERVGQGIDEFRQLVRRARDWTAADASRATRLGSELELLAGGGDATASREPARPGGGAGDLHTGVRAFVGRECALIASALDRAAQALAEDPGGREPLYAVLRRMQSLRGLAELSELTPLPEILDGIELAVGDLTRLFAPPAGVSDLLGAGAQALSRVARDVAGGGVPDPDPPEARRFTELLLAAFAVERDVVAIESLYFAGDEAPARPAEGQPEFSTPSPLSDVELVSYGEHLAQAGDRIGAAPSDTTRDLRMYALVGTLRSLATAGSDAVPSALAVFGRSARDAIGSGRAAGNMAEFHAALGDAGELLRSLATGADSHAVGRRLLDVAYRLDAPAPPVPEGAEADPVEIGSLGYEADIVPIGTLELPGPGEAAAERQPLEASFATYARLIRDRGLQATSLEELTGVPERPASTPVDIRSLCYRGRAALERAATIRVRLAARLDGRADLAVLEPMLRELLDLVPLALESAD